MGWKQGETIPRRKEMGALTVEERAQLVRLGRRGAKELLSLSQCTYHSLSQAGGVTTVRKVAEVRERLSALRAKGSE
jgi:hypothetical protein